MLSQRSQRYAITEAVVQGIWDCLSSQQVVDIVRYEISEGKELSEITELICDHCLAPDETAGDMIGCDNMTILIVAILHGRTKEEWYSWIADRVKNKYGYETPSALPQLYSPSRLMSFRARQEALEARNKSRQEEENSIALIGNATASSVGISTSIGESDVLPSDDLKAQGKNIVYIYDWVE